MKQSLKKYGLVACVLALSACDKTPGVYPNKGDPESLIDLSSETVTLGLSSKNALARLADMVAEDKPTGAQLKCSLNSNRCAQAKEIFERNLVPIHLTNEKNNSVVLSYERVVVRDCNPHYIDNMSGSRSYNHPSFGCAVAGNMVQMVSDKRQFTNPGLLDFPDAEKAEQNYKNYLKPSDKREAKDANWVSTTADK
jgi:hypothetical protein